MKSSEVLPDNVIAAIRAGHKIQAIKALRERHNVGLREAKDMVESYIDEHPELEIKNTSNPGMGCLLFLAAILAAAYFAYQQLM